MMTTETNNEHQDNSGNKDDNADNNGNNEDEGNNNEDKDSTAAVAGSFVGGGGGGGGDSGGIGGGSFGGWREVAVVSLVVGDRAGGACSGHKPSGGCLERLIGSQFMANDAMDVQAKAISGGGRAAAALLVFCVCALCVWMGSTCAKKCYLSICRGPKNLQIDKGLSVLLT
jgi:hypothetical protein